jgi:hypothetical protein
VVVGAVYFAMLSQHGARMAMLSALAALGCTIAGTIVFLQRMRPRPAVATAT